MYSFIFRQGLIKNSGSIRNVTTISSNSGKNVTNLSNNSTNLSQKGNVYNIIIKFIKDINNVNFFLLEKINENPGYYVGVAGIATISSLGAAITWKVLDKTEKRLEKTIEPIKKSVEKIENSEKVLKLNIE
jgi:hypothetical protein